jgi:integrase
MWWYRRRVPRELQPIIGRAEYRETLDTPDIAVARTRAALRNAAVEVEFEMARAKLREESLEKPVLPDSLTPDSRRYITDAVRTLVLLEDEETRMARLETETLWEYESQRGDQFDETSRALATGRVALGKEGRQRIQALMHAIGLSVAPGSPAWEEAAFKATEGWNLALRDIRERTAGEYVPTPAAPEMPAALRPVPTSAPVLPSAALTLGKVIDGYLSSLRETDFTRKVRRCLQLFGAMVGRDLPVTELRQMTVTNFLRDICKLPNEWARRFDKGESVEALLSEGAERVMSPTTYNDNYRAPLGTFLAAAARDHGDEGFPTRTVDGIEYSGNRAADEDQQRSLSDEELRVLFEGEAFAAVATDPAQEPLYWFSLVMLLTGARPREVCQANPQVDFGNVDDHWYMDLDERSAAGKGIRKTIKTGEARRIPLHAELVRLGFPEYVQRIRDAGADRLFPSWRIKQGNPYTAHGSLFSDLLRAAGLYTTKAGEQVTGAYTLRKTFITQCRNQGVVSKEITGHSDGTTTAIQDRHYIFGPEPLHRKAAELRKLIMPCGLPLHCRSTPSTAK